MKIHKDIAGYEYWYDPQIRSWYAAVVDSVGNILRCVDCYTKKEIIFLIKRGF